MRFKRARLVSFSAFSLAFLVINLAMTSVAWSAVPESRSSEGVQEPAAEAAQPLAPSTESSPADAENTDVVAEPVDSSAVQVTQPGNVTVDFKNADIQSVLRILAFKSGVNIVAGKDVTGAVTIRLVDVPWEKALETILKTDGYAYDRQDNIIRVSTLENLQKEDLSTEVYPLNYSKAADVEKSVKEMLSERGSARSDARSNSLIVTDMPTSLQSIRKVIERLDSATPQVLIEAKVVELTLGKADQLGIDWNVRAAITGASRPITAPFSATQRSALSKFLPIGRGTQTGAVASSSGTTTTTIEDFPKGKGGAGSDAIQPTFPVADKAEFTFGSLDFSQFRAVLEMIQKQQDTKVLSEPHVTVLSNQEAKILVGEIIAIPTFERNSTTGKMEITGYNDRDLGIRLAVVPQVNNSNEIVVSIHPEITNLIGYDDLTGEIKAPRFSTREAMTNVRIKSGQTIAIGGLIKEDVLDENNKVPLLGDIPGLGKLFSYQNKQVTKTDLLFFVTVTVIQDTVPTAHKL